MNKIEQYNKYLNNLVIGTEETFSSKTDEFKDSLITELEFEFQRENILPLLTSKEKIQEIAEKHYYAGYKRFSGDIYERNNKHLDILDDYSENYTMISKLILEHHQININKIKFLVDDEQLNPFYSTIDAMSREIFDLLKTEHEYNQTFKIKEYIMKKVIKEVVDKEIVKTTSISKNKIFNYSSREFNQIHSEIVVLSKPTDVIQENLPRNEEQEFKELLINFSNDQKPALDTSIFDLSNPTKETTNAEALDTTVFDIPKVR
jgi:hypothetical protein